jgi:hypothetical protein
MAVVAMGTWQNKHNKDMQPNVCGQKYTGT